MSTDAELRSTELYKRLYCVAIYHAMNNNSKVTITVGPGNDINKVKACAELIRKDLATLGFTVCRTSIQRVSSTS